MSKTCEKKKVPHYNKL